MSEVDNAAAAAEGDFTPAERAYFDTRGEAAPEATAEPAEAGSETPGAEATEASETAPEPSKEERKVNYGALAEERARRKEVEERLRSAEILQARMEERFRALFPPQRPKAVPKPEEDVFGAVSHLMEENKRTRAEIEAYKQRMSADQHWSQLARNTSMQEEQFKKTNPDYDDAWAHLVRSRAAEMRYLGANDQMIVAQLQNDARSMMAQAARAGKNPGELVYEFAKQRGYQKKQAASDATRKLDAIEAGQQASKSLSTVGGRAGGGEVTLEDLARMSDEDFAAYKEKSPAKFRRLMGAGR